MHAPSRFVFNHTWQVAAPVERVRALVEDVAGYGGWWQGIRVTDGNEVGRRWADIRVTAPLGYRIRIRITEDDPGHDALRARISGDLEGWCSWRLQPRDAATEVRFDQQVVVRARLLRPAVPIARGLLSRQHTAVMRAAEQGMLQRLEAR